MERGDIALFSFAGQSPNANTDWLVERLWTEADTFSILKLSTFRYLVRNHQGRYISQHLSLISNLLRFL